MPTEQNHSKFIFTSCESLEQAAKEEITSYAQRKCQLLSNSHKRYNGDLLSESLFSTSFPGCLVPSWFCHETVGSELKVKLLPHWDDKKLAGIALCTVVSCLDSQDQICSLSVTCTFKVKDEDKSWVPFTCPVGSWTRNGDQKDKSESEHVLIGYTSLPHTIKCLEDGNSDGCNPSEASLRFTVSSGTSEEGKFKVLKCGFSLVYAKDKNKNIAYEAKYDMPGKKSFQETSTGVDGRGAQCEKAKPVGKNFQETSKGVDGRGAQCEKAKPVGKSFQETSKGVDERGAQCEKAKPVGKSFQVTSKRVNGVAKYEKAKPVEKSIQENSEGVDGRPVEKSFQVYSEGLDGRVKKPKKMYKKKEGNFSCQAHG